MYVYRNNEVRSRDQFSGESSKYYIRVVEVTIFCADRRTNMTKVTAAFEILRTRLKNDQTKNDKTGKSRKLKTLSGYISVKVTGK
jgi:hypothetical protein